MPRGSTERPDTPAKRRPLVQACLLSLGAAACDACDIRPQLERKLAAYVAAIDPDRGSAPPLASALQRLPPRPQRRHTAAWQRVAAACGFAPVVEVGG